MKDPRVEKRRMELFQVIEKRHSVRHFSDDPVTEEDLLTILEAACSAPSATNEQPWHFIVIRDHELKDQMRDLVNAMIDSYIEASQDQESRERISAMRFYSTHFADALVAIAVLARPWGNAPDLPTRELGLASVSAAITHLQLAATALGYGSCWATGPVQFAGEELEALLGVHKPWFLMAMVSLGMAARQPNPTPRRPLEEVCTFIG